MSVPLRLYLQSEGHISVADTALTSDLTLGDSTSQDFFPMPLPADQSLVEVRGAEDPARRDSIYSALDQVHIHSARLVAEGKLPLSL